MSHLWSVGLRACLVAFDELDIDTDHICERVGIDRRTLDDVDARIPIHITNAIWPVAAELYGEDVGIHAGAALPFGALEALDYVIATAPTVGEAIESFARYFVVMTEGATRFEVERDAESVRLAFHGPVGGRIRDYALSAVAGRLRRVGAVVEGASFTWPTDRDRTSYTAVFGVPVRFGAPQDAVVVAAGSMERRIEPRLQGLRPVVIRELDDLLQGIDRDRTMQQVQGAILRHLSSGAPKLADVARRLHLSPRTLQRRLADRGVSFTQVLDETRAALARARLLEPGWTVTDVAFMLGFADPSSFSRAFVRWFDESPSDFRDRHAD